MKHLRRSYNLCKYAESKLEKEISGMLPEEALKIIQTPSAYAHEKRKALSRLLKKNPKSSYSSLGNSEAGSMLAHTLLGSALGGFGGTLLSAKGGATVKDPRLWASGVAGTVIGGLAPHLLGALMAPTLGRRSLKAQQAYENSPLSKWENWLLPGVSYSNVARSLDGPIQELQGDPKHILKELGY